MHVWPIILKNWRKEILAFFAKVGEAVLELMVPVSYTHLTLPTN